ncbi:MULTISPECIES: DUF2812 domain-containing protein [Lysinibacillus]|uniref:DUF2812 domain-containing protein n=1 Tax=Lysinibacillus TaxID=400634 RepID=UPI0006AFF833|nr:MULTISPECIES: DUF2812 domain-containing protein [Lysinibacillus]KOS64169.1 hypothetical protein AN161_02945 [Lysinibacillus sp. FJAT-14222]
MDKYRLVINPYDIEKWVNDMASQGWHLQKFTWIRFILKNVENQVATKVNWRDLVPHMKKDLDVFTD